MALFRRSQQSDKHDDHTRGSTAESSGSTRSSGEPSQHRAEHRETEHTAQHASPAGSREDAEARRRERFGGINWGAAIFGWLVAIALTVLLAGIISALATAIGASIGITQTQAQQQAGSLGLATVIVLLLVLFLAYLGGGYVAGRMSRFAGARQGLAVWVIGLLVAILVGVVGAVFGSQYDIFAQVNLPSMPMPNSTMTLSGVIAIVAALVVTLLGSMLGGKLGRRYHRKVDRAGY